ncbi:hypothetical protein Lser_V15G45329 [Lactuca serriola]
MGSPAAGRCNSQNSTKRVFPGRSSSTESKLETSSSPCNHPLKGKNKMHEEDEGIIISPTYSGVVEQDSANRKIMSSSSEKLTRIEDLITSNQDSRKIQNSSNVMEIYNYSNMIQQKRNEVMRKYLDFKKFDIVEDYSDHHYKVKGPNSEKMQPQKNWAKRIQKEWRMLKKALPDTIFVRVYESRMDLLRAVIIGAEGTPYHDGLFFFDVFFPYKYPDVPPKVHYHSSGLIINPNLRYDGKVCLSLLNTWSGGKNEKWTPGVSTMLQVLVSIQGLILNEKPYFNDPIFARPSGSRTGEYRSMKYNERTLIYSLKTMVYTMRNPPKHFEDLVIGHFHNRAVSILTICRGYTKGVRVGCGVNVGEEKSSQGFQKNVERLMRTLVRAFEKIGVDNVNEFIPEIVPEFTPQTRNMAQKIRAFFCIKG